MTRYECEVCDPDTKIFLQPGQDDFGRISAWKCVKEVE